MRETSEATRDVDPECIFCKIVRGDFATPFVATSERAVAFRDADPKAATHVLVVSKRHIPRLQLVEFEGDSTAGEMLGLAVEVARREGLLESGYRVLTNDGLDAGQSVGHLHFHVLGGNRLSMGLG